MARPSFETDRKTFLAAVPRKKPISNGALRTELGWQDLRYWKVHSALREEGRINVGRGRGGTLIRA